MKCPHGWEVGRGRNWSHYCPSWVGLLGRQRGRSEGLEQELLLWCKPAGWAGRWLSEEWNPPSMTLQVYCVSREELELLLPQHWCYGWEGVGVAIIPPSFLLHEPARQIWWCYKEAGRGGGGATPATLQQLNNMGQAGRTSSAKGRLAGKCLPGQWREFGRMGFLLSHESELCIIAKIL